MICADQNDTATSRERWTVPQLVVLPVTRTEVGVTSVNQDFTNPASEFGSFPIT